jgi:long-subunit acyl-CoA synthetase (AMP-forming)
MLTFDTGEEIDPLPQERKIITDPMVHGAVVFGRGKSKCGILVQPAPECTVNLANSSALMSFRDSIWYVSDFFFVYPTDWSTLGPLLKRLI